MWPAALEFCAKCGNALTPRSASLFWCSPTCMESWTAAARPEWWGRPPVAGSTSWSHPRTAAAVVREAYEWLDVRVRSRERG